MRNPWLCEWGKGVKIVIHPSWGGIQIHDRAEKLNFVRIAGLKGQGNNVGGEHNRGWQWLNNALAISEEIMEKKRKQDSDF